LVPIRSTDALRAVQERMQEHLTGTRVERRTVLGRWRRAR
jgi:hypothetical protein